MYLTQRLPSFTCFSLQSLCPCHHHFVTYQTAAWQRHLRAAPLSNRKGLAVTAIAVMISLKPVNGGITFYACDDIIIIITCIIKSERHDDVIV